MLTFVITLAGPTGAPVSLAGNPPPASEVEAFCLGNSTGPGINFERTYSLNNRAQPVVRAHGRVRFAMHLALPATRCPTTKLIITWPFPVFIPEGTYTFFSLELTR